MLGATTALEVALISSKGWLQSGPERICVCATYVCICVHTYSLSYLSGLKRQFVKYSCQNEEREAASFNAMRGKII